MGLIQERLTRRDNLLARQRPVALRRCLKCDYWMRSTGPDHRLCNHCKRDYHAVDQRQWEGARLCG